MITKSQFLDWKNHPVTQEFFSDVREARDSKEEELYNGHNVENHALMAQSVGLLRAYESILNYNPDFNEDGYMIDLEGAVVE